MDDETHRRGGGEEELVPRYPSVEDLVGLCRALNREEARYLVVGGFAMRGAGYNRQTIDTSPENEAKVYRALESLPDQRACAGVS